MKIQFWKNKFNGDHYIHMDEEKRIDGIRYLKVLRCTAANSVWISRASLEEATATEAAEFIKRIRAKNPVRGID